MRLELRNPTQAEWDEFISPYPNTIFQSSAWGKVMEEGYNSEALFFILMEGKDLLLGLTGNVLNLRIIRLFFCNYLYGGFIGQIKYANSFLALLEDKLKEKNIDRIRFTKSYSDNMPQLESYTESISYQHILNLDGKNIDSLWKDYKPRTRRDVLKARKSDVIVKGIEKEEEIDIYYKLYLATMKRNLAIGPHPRSFYAALYKNFIQLNRGIILFAMYKKQYIAAVSLIFSENTAYLLGSVSLEEYLNYCPNDLLIHSAIEESINRGMHTFDFMTSSSYDLRLMQFKEKWGAEKFLFGTFEKDLTSWKPKLWDLSWKLVNSNIFKGVFASIIDRYRGGDK